MSEYSPELGPYNTQVQQASNHTEKLVAGVASLALGIGSTRAVAQGAAADYQQMSSGMAAATRVTHQSYGQLSQDVRSLTRQFPESTRGALATVQAVQALGVTAKGQEGQVGALSKQLERLSAATGEAAPALANDFGQLTREMSSLDPARVQKFADVLVSSSARSGASAGAITGFAKAIAPMAQAAGVGESSVLGISTSFAKLGDDGYVAANAVSKMFGDLNRAVHDGSNDMAGYANAVGMTIDQFKALYQADPAKAVARVTEAIGKMPAGQGQRTLEQLGITGVRAQRAFLEQAQSGGMTADINAARAAYGSGSANKAADTGLSTVQNSLTRLGNAAEDVASAFERPLLHSVNTIVSAAGAVSRGIGNVVSSGPVSGALSIGAQAAVPLMAARFGVRALNTGALASFFLRGGPATGLMAGARIGRRGGLDEALADPARSKNVQAMLEAAQAGMPLGATAGTAARNARALEIGSTLGALFPQGQPGVSMFQRARGLGVQGLSFVARGQSELYRIARMPAMERDQMRVAGFTEPHQRFAAHLVDLKDQLDKGTIAKPEALKSAVTEFGRLNAEAGQTSKAMAELGAAVKTLGVEGTVTGASGVLGAAKLGIKGGLSAAGSFLTSGAGVATVGIGAAYLGYKAYSGSQEQQKAFNEHADNLDAYGSVNAYRDQMGKAGESAMSLSKQFDAAAESVSAAASTFDEASKVTGQDIGVAGKTQKNVSQYFSGSAAQMGAQASMLALGKMQPSDVQGAKLDMLRQGYNQTQVTQALSGVGQGTTDTLTPQQITDAVAGMSHARGIGGTGGFNWIKRATSTGFGTSSEWDKLGLHGGGHAELGKQAQSELDLATGALQQEQSNMSGRYGGKYAIGQTLKDADKMMTEALKSHNADLVVGMEQQLTANLTGGKAVTGMSAADIEGAGGISGILAAHNRSIGGVNIRDLMKTGAGPGTMIEDAVAGTLTGQGNPMARFFSNFKTGVGATDKAQTALAASAAAPDDLQKQHDAAMAIVDASQKAGESLGDLAAASVKTTQSMADGDARRAVMLQVMEEAGRRLQNSLGGMTIGQQFRAQSTYASSLSQVTGNSPESQQARQQGQQMASQQLNSERDYMKQRLMAQFQFEIASQRANEDYHKAVARANEDFALQQKRQAEDAAKAMYSPYQRIQAQPVWDVQNLMGNQSEQIRAMREQIANIRKLKKLGLSQEAIDQLSLYDPAKAQQTAEMVAELSSSRGEVGQLNRQAHTRVQLAGQLTKEDPAVRRATQDFHTAMNRQAADFATQTKRMGEDLANADRELTGNMTTLQADMVKILHHQQVDWSKSLTNNLANTIKAIQDTTPQLLSAQQAAVYSATDQTVTPSTTVVNPTDSGGGAVAGRGVNVMHAASGGIVSRDQLVRLAEAGSREAIIPLNQQGADFLAMSLRQALRQVHGHGRSYGSPVVVETHHYDQGQHIHGPVTVKANTPAEWANQARASQRKANLTAPRSVRWGRASAA